MGIVGLIGGTEAELVGVEDHGDGGLRLYLQHRARGVYALVYDEDVKRQVQASWKGTSSRITVPMPPAHALYRDPASSPTREDNAA